MRKRSDWKKGVWVGMVRESVQPILSLNLVLERRSGVWWCIGFEVGFGVWVGVGGMILGVLISIGGETPRMGTIRVQGGTSTLLPVNPNILRLLLNYQRWH